MPSLNGSTSHSGRDGRPLTSSKDRLCSAVTTSGPQFEIGSPRIATDIAAYRSGFSFRLTTPLPGEGGAMATPTATLTRDARAAARPATVPHAVGVVDRKSTRLNSSHLGISYAVFCLK